jgi:hypothetical protein
MDRRVLATALGVAALALPTAAAADSAHLGASGRGTSDHGAKGKAPKKVAFVFKGTFTAPGTIAVLAGNAHVRKGGFVGHTVTFDLTDAKVVVADTNADAKVDLTDVKDGDTVLVQARVPRGTKYAEPAEGEAAVPVVARRLIDKTNPPVDAQEPASGE